MYFFSLNFSSQIPVLKEKLTLLNRINRKHITFICMYGYNTTLSQDIARCCFLDQEGISPFVQKYQPIRGCSKSGCENYFDTDIEPLVKMSYSRLGRNFENFLKWVSKKYAKEYGELYMPIVEIIFKYNSKHTKHKYIETLAGTRKLS